MRTVLADLGPLRESPAFRRLWLGSTVSALGSRAGAFAVTFYVWDRTHNPAAVGLIGLVTAAPLIAFALLGSAVTDHVDRRRLVLGCTAGQLAVSLAMAGTVGTTGAGVPVMLGLAGIAAGLSAIGEPARRTIITQLLPRDRLPAGLALNQLAFQLSILVGPAAAGLITARWGTGACFVVDAVSFAAALIGVAGLPAAPPAGGPRPPGTAAVLDGIRFVARTPAVRAALLADLCATGLAMPMALFPVLNQEKFGGSPAVLGLFTSAVAVGGVVASVLSGLATRRRHPGVVLLACGAVWATALGTIGLTARLPAVLALLAVAGGADTWAVVGRATVTQGATPPSHRGRVAALEHIVGAAGPQLGDLRAGLIAARTSGATALLIGAASALIGTAAIAARSPALRHFTPAEPVPETAPAT